MLTQGLCYLQVGQLPHATPKLQEQQASARPCLQADPCKSQGRCSLQGKSLQPKPRRGCTPNCELLNDT